MRDDYPNFPRDGREFWRRVWHGDVPDGLRYVPDKRRAARLTCMTHLR